MFTGLVQAVGRVVQVTRGVAGVRLEVEAEGLTRTPREGDSVAVDGACLTVVASGAGRLSFDIVQQTLALTTLGSLASGMRVNLEPALPADGLLGGHLVLGHVDGVGSVVAREGERLAVEVPESIAGCVVSQGCIAIAGVSLTVAEASGRRVEVSLIPETLLRTTLVALRVGDRVNVEADHIAKLVESAVARALAARAT